MSDLNSEKILFASAGFRCKLFLLFIFFLRRCLTIEDVFEVAAAPFVQRQQVRALGQVGNLELGRQEVLEDEGPLRVPLDHV